MSIDRWSLKREVQYSYEIVYDRTRKGWPFNTRWHQGAGLTVNIKYVLKDHCTIIMYILFIENWQQNNTCIILFVFMKQSTFMYTHILVIKQELNARMIKLNDEECLPE